MDICSDNGSFMFFLMNNGVIMPLENLDTKCNSIMKPLSYFISTYCEYCTIVINEIFLEHVLFYVSEKSMIA